jgi:hypothetical protein
MKSKFLFILLIVFSNSTFSQEKKEVIKGDELIIDVPENGKLENGIYSCFIFDWKIEIPDGYQITDIKRIEELGKKGYEALKKEVPEGQQLKPHPKHLVGFGIDKRNNFSSSIESLKGTKRVSLEEHEVFVAQLLTDTYSKVNGLKFEVSKSLIKIGKYDFYKIRVKLYNSKTEELLLTQDLYNSFIKDYLFSVNINFSNETVEKLLTDNFLKSLK